MKELDSGYFEMINKAISRSDRSESNFSVSFEEWIYYDEYDDITLK